MLNQLDGNDVDAIVVDSVAEFLAFLRGMLDDEALRCGCERTVDLELVAGIGCSDSNISVLVNEYTI